jgi:hypothetical protein
LKLFTTLSPSNNISLRSLKTDSKTNFEKKSRMIRSEKESAVMSPNHKQNTRIQSTNRIDIGLIGNQIDPVKVGQKSRVLYTSAREELRVNKEKLLRPITAGIPFKKLKINYGTAYSLTNFFTPSSKSRLELNNKR